MPSLLVLGGTGFIGKHIINKAVSKRWAVTSASLSLPSKKRRIKKVKYLKVDLKNFAIVKKKINEVSENSLKNIYYWFNNLKTKYFIKAIDESYKSKIQS